MFTLKEVFAYQKENNISDIHLVTGAKPYARNHQGELKKFSDETIEASTMDAFITELCNKEETTKLKEFGNLDKAVDIENIARFRINIFTERRGYGMNFRIIPADNIDIRNYNIPTEVVRHVLGRSGLILVSGPNNSGKTTILNSFIDLINERKKVKIITFEDPIEYIHEQKKALICQHEISQKHKDQLQGDLKSVFRQDANIVCIGEIRDASMMNLALEMCETGYLVMGTIHGVDTIQTIQRIGGLFNEGNRKQLYKQLASQLKTVFCQHLIPGTENQQERCREVLMSTDAIKSLIANGEFNELYTQIETDTHEGSILFDQYLINLFNDGRVTQDTLVEYAHDLSYVNHVIKH